MLWPVTSSRSLVSSSPGLAVVALGKHPIYHELFPKLLPQILKTTFSHQMLLPRENVRWVQKIPQLCPSPYHRQYPAHGCRCTTQAVLWWVPSGCLICFVCFLSLFIYFYIFFGKVSQDFIRSFVSGQSHTIHIYHPHGSPAVSPAFLQIFWLFKQPLFQLPAGGYGRLRSPQSRRVALRRNFWDFPWKQPAIYWGTMGYPLFQNLHI